MNRKNRNTKKFIPVTLKDGTKTSVKADTIPENAWTKHHGVAEDGTPVQSLKTYKVPGSGDILVSNDGAILRTNMAELEILAKNLFADTSSD